MAINRKKVDNSKNEIDIGNFKFEIVECFKYLGTIISNRNDRKWEVEQRIQAGHRAYYKFKDIMQNKGISKKTKLKIYKIAIKPVAYVIKNNEPDKNRRRAVTNL